jgi:hypothetical protein
VSFFNKVTWDDPNVDAWFAFSSRSFNFWSFPMESSMPPENLLPLNRSSSKLMKLLSSFGMVPMNSYLSKLRFQVDKVAELLWDGADELAPLQVKVREVKKVGGPRHYLASNEAEDTHELGAPGTSDPG